MPRVARYETGDLNELWPSHCNKADFKLRIDNLPWGDFMIKDEIAIPGFGVIRENFYGVQGIVLLK